MKRKKHKKVKIFPFTITITAVLIIFFSLRIINKSIRSTAVMQANNYSRVIAEEIISECVTEYISENSSTYNEYIKIESNKNGDISSIEAKTDEINRMQAEIAGKINSKMKNNSDYRIKIPIGSLTDSYIWSGKGIKIPLRVNFTGQSDIKLKSEFVSAGINQTCHRIWAEIKVKMDSAIPLYRFSTENEFEYLISETIIVGETPDTSLIMKNV